MKSNVKFLVLSLDPLSMTRISKEALSNVWATKDNKQRLKKGDLSRVGIIIEIFIVVILPLSFTPNILESEKNQRILGLVSQNTFQLLDCQQKFCLD